jgi:aspartate ammonia-lyase
MNPSSSRQESGCLGTRSIPATAYWGVQTARAAENFPISGQPLPCTPEPVRSLAFVKNAAAQSNAALDVVDADTEQALVMMTAAEVQTLLVPERLTRPSRLTG